MLFVCIVANKFTTLCACFLWQSCEGSSEKGKFRKVGRSMLCDMAFSLLEDRVNVRAFLAALNMLCAKYTTFNTACKGDKKRDERHFVLSRKVFEIVFVKRPRQMNRVMKNRIIFDFIHIFRIPAVFKSFVRGS